MRAPYPIDVTIISQILHGTAIYADQLGSFGGQCRHIWQSHGVSGYGIIWPRFCAFGG